MLVASNWTQLLDLLLALHCSNVFDTSLRPACRRGWWLRPRGSGVGRGANFISIAGLLHLQSERQISAMRGKGRDFSSPHYCLSKLLFNKIKTLLKVFPLPWRRERVNGGTHKRLSKHLLNIIVTSYVISPLVMNI